MLQKGDLNDDRKLDEADVNIMVRYIMGDTPKDFDKTTVDLNDDGEVNVADLVALIELVKLFSLIDD